MIHLIDWLLRALSPLSVCGLSEGIRVPVLIRIFPSGCYDPRSTLADHSGFGWRAHLNPSRYGDLELRRGVRTVAVTPNAQVVGRDAADRPVLLSRDVGRGRVYFQAADVVGYPLLELLEKIFQDIRPDHDWYLAAEVRLEEQHQHAAGMSVGDPLRHPVPWSPSKLRADKRSVGGDRALMAPLCHGIPKNWLSHPACPWRDDVGRVQFTRSSRTRTREGIRMKTQAIATVEKGQLTLDKPLDLPDRSRVQLTVEPIADSGDDPVAAWQSLRQRVRERPVYSGGRHFSRDELHERR